MRHVDGVARGTVSDGGGADELGSSTADEDGGAGSSLVSWEAGPTRPVTPWRSRRRGEQQPDAADGDQEQHQRHEHPRQPGGTIRRS
jgi:hypothetical protein